MIITSNVFIFGIFIESIIIVILVLPSLNISLGEKKYVIYSLIHNIYIFQILFSNKYIV